MFHTDGVIDFMHFKIHGLGPISSTYMYMIYLYVLLLLSSFGKAVDDDSKVKLIAEAVQEGYLLSFQFDFAEA